MRPSVVYTAIANNYDTLKRAPGLWLGEARFVAFLDSAPRDLGWEVAPVYRRFRDPCRNAKIHKALPHRYFPDAEYSLWIDGSVVITPLLTFGELVRESLKDSDLAVYRHRYRQCIYQEGAWCLANQMDRPEIISRQMQRYYDEGYPANNGLAHCLLIFRRHTKKIQRFNERWYAEIKSHSRRDQLSFNYAAHQLGVKITYLPGSISANPHFRLSAHARRRSPP